ncbi:hypothetical protein D3P07_04025 [Paenibacillus sp. 1011MAR3C5]|uniref:hypothetical protein n=1 Tax=Paenibacillus sp. 1011MAR3C5 TaxID=1675787 RepID=UPI000E6D3559|nr:hypothetical protein [Paenibacillus sp. 1011MAR3C5]RJE91234.1 hypothetical protein D3P07_04025 [Paenibacillus sp. 1011MAR3C5]
MNLTKIPNGDEKVTVELTVKELMALAGVHFHSNHDVKVSARRKLNMVLEDAWEKDGKDNAPISYQFLN